jgi:glycerophosphodiester phosphodiesterase
MSRYALHLYTGVPISVPANNTVLQIQVKEGIDAVIVDSVLAIRKGLTGSDEDAPPPVEETNGVVLAADPLVSKDDRSNGAAAGTISPSKRVVVETVNGVPVYADGGLGSDSGAIFP